MKQLGIARETFRGAIARLSVVEVSAGDVKRLEPEDFVDPHTGLPVTRVLINTFESNTAEGASSTLGDCCTMAVESLLAITIATTADDATEASIENVEKELWPHIADAQASMAIHGIGVAFESRSITQASVEDPVVVMRLVFSLAFEFNPRGD